MGPNAGVTQPPAIFDSNIIIDALNRHEPAREVIEAMGRGSTTLSRISWIEVMAGPKDEHLRATEAYLRGCNIIELTPVIAARAALVRRVTRLKLADAVIWATALVTQRILVTRDDQDFPADWPGVHHPYIVAN